MGRAGAAAHGTSRVARWWHGETTDMHEGEDDPRERLLPPLSPPMAGEHQDECDDEQVMELTIEDLAHSLGSFTAVALPVTLTMLASSFVSLYVVDQATAQALADAYLVYHPEAEPQSSGAHRFEEALVNALVIVSFFLVATFVIVACYKFNFNRLLLGYMMFSSAMLLGLLGGNMAAIAIGQHGVVIDIYSFLLIMYNFSVVGVVAVFYQHGISTRVTQVYLVVTSIIMAWQLGQFPEWSTWALVIVLAFYDLCAVLTPCGPLKWLVNLVQQEGRPLPGLLYEAEVQTQPVPSPALESNSHRHDASPVVASSTTSGDNRYYQFEQSAIPTAETTESALTSSPTETQITSSHDNNAILRERLTEFYARYNPAAIPRIDHIIGRYQGRERDLWLALAEKYVLPEEEATNTIKLGLGDFVFYSVLVSRAAMLDFAAMVGCLVAVLTGLSGTMLLLAVYKKALPALPISIFLAVTIFFWMRFTYIPLLDLAMPYNVMM